MRADLFLGRFLNEALRSVPDIDLDFPRDIQPILDRHCVRCHNPDRRDGDTDLCGDHTPTYSVSYWTIIKRQLISDARNGFGNRPPRFAPDQMDARTEAGNHDFNVITMLANQFPGRK